MAKKQFPLMLEPNQREKFEKAADAHPFADNLTDFFRAVAGAEAEALLNDKDDKEEVEVDLTELENGQDQINNKLDNIIELLEDINVQTTTDPAVDECAAEIIQYAPKDPEVEVLSREPMGADFGSIRDRVTTAGRLTDIVSLLHEDGYDEYTIRRAASKAENEISDFHSTSIDGELRYYFWNEQDARPDAVDSDDDDDVGGE